MKNPKPGVAASHSELICDQLKVLKIAQHFLWLTLKKQIRGTSGWLIHCFFLLVSVFITLTVSSPWESLYLKPIQKWFESQSIRFWQQCPSRLKSGAVLFHLSDPPTLQVKTFHLPMNQLLIHQFSLAHIRVNKIWISPLSFNEWHSARSRVHVCSCLRGVMARLGQAVMAHHYVSHLILILCCTSVKAWSWPLKPLRLLNMHGEHLWEVFWLKDLGRGWGRGCALNSILNRYFCSIKSSVGG